MVIVPVLTSKRVFDIYCITGRMETSSLRCLEVGTQCLVYWNVNKRKTLLVSKPPHTLFPNAFPIKPDDHVGVSRGWR